MWSKQEMVTYLKLLGVYNQTIRIVIHYGLNQPQSFDNIKDLMGNFTYPSMWKSCIQIEEFIETPMHHLFECVLEEVNNLKCLYNRCEPFTGGKDFKTGGLVSRNIFRIFTIDCHIVWSC